MNQFKCIHMDENGNEQKWTGTWEPISTGPGCHELRVCGRGSDYTVVLGQCSTGNYLVIPVMNIGCGLAGLTDVFWNAEQLSRVINTADAVTIATALNDYKRH